MKMTSASPAVATPSRFAPATLSRLEPSVHAVVKDELGFSEPRVLHAAMEMVQAGGGVEHLKGRLAPLMESRKASRLASKIGRAVEEFCVAHDIPTLAEAAAAASMTTQEVPRKRKGGEEDPGVPTKAAKTEEGAGGDSSSSGGGFQAMTPEQIREIMNKTKREIAQRMAQLNTTKEANQAKLVGPQKPSEIPVASAAATMEPPGIATIPASAAAAAASDKSQTLAALQARIASSLSRIGDKLPPQPPGSAPQITLDAQGRTVDAASGQQIQLSQHVPTLKANLRAKKRDEMREHLKEGPAQTNALQVSHCIYLNLTRNIAVISFLRSPSSSTPVWAARERQGPSAPSSSTSRAASSWRASA